MIFKLEGLTHRIDGNVFYFGFQILENHIINNNLNFKLLWLSI
jgi:hypothetical protein